MAQWTTSSLKRKLMMMIAEDEITFKTIDNKNAEYPDDLFGTRTCNQSIFSQLKIDFTEQEAGTYVCIKIDYPSICKNELYKYYILTVLIVSNNAHLKAPNGLNRTDIIAESLINLFNGNDILGFTLELESDIEDPLSNKHYYRKLKLRSISSNSVNNGVKNHQRS